MIKTELKNVRKGGLLRLKDNEKAPLWIQEGYERYTKTYQISKYEDINHYLFRKGNVKVFAVCEFDLKKGCR